MPPRAFRSILEIYENPEAKFFLMKNLGYRPLISFFTKLKCKQYKMTYQDYLKASKRHLDACQFMYRCLNHFENASTHSFKTDYN